MPVNYTYGLYPFPWTPPVVHEDGVVEPGYHSPPAGSACVLDLRPLAEQAKASQSSGYGLFAWASNPPGDLVSLGTGYAPELLIDNAARNELRIKLGLASNPTGATLADAMADVLTSQADPLGLAMAKPIMPTSDGRLELHLAGHSQIWWEMLDGAAVMSASPKGKHNRIRDVIRADLDAAERVGGVVLLQKCLGAWLLKLGVSREELKAGAGGRKAQYDRLMSAAVKAKHGANARPARPTTLVSESWPTDAADLTGSAQDNSWTELAVDGFADGLKVASGTLRATSAFSSKLGVCGSPVSAADHVVSGAITCTVGGGLAYVCARQHATRGTGYSYGWYWGQTRVLQKWVLGTPTTLSIEVESSAPSGVVVECDADGSTIAGRWPSRADQSVTDTSITGNLYGGAIIRLDAAVETYGQVGAWSIDDGLSGGGGGPIGVIGSAGIGVSCGIGFNRR